jgi:hypothetical protein
MVITVKPGKPDHGRETAPGVIMHYKKEDELVEIEILDASELISATVREMAENDKRSIGSSPSNKVISNIRKEKYA